MTTPPKPDQPMEPLAVLHRATLRRGSRVIWQGLDLKVWPGELIAVLGPNGAGKTTVLKALLGLIPLSAGQATLNLARDVIGYLPQQKPFDPDLNVRGRDIVQLGLSGTRYGWSTDRDTTERVERAIESVGATAFAEAPVGRLSGGEQQRIRIAQLLVNQPCLLLCDEPFLSLDAGSQHTVATLLGERTQAGSAVLFVTHDLSAELLPLVSRVLYIVNGRWKLEDPDTILSARSLGQLYGTPVEVIRAGGRILVLPKTEHEQHRLGEGSHE